MNVGTSTSGYTRTVADDAALLRQTIDATSQRLSAVPERSSDDTDTTGSYSSQNAQLSRLRSAEESAEAESAALPSGNPSSSRMWTADNGARGYVPGSVFETYA